MDTRHGASPTVAAAALANKPLVFSKMESMVREMQIPDSGIPIGDQKIFLTSIPSVFMGYDLVEWLMERLEIDDSAEAIHLANLLCQYGYFFPVGETRSLIVKDDSSLYRFQTPYFWPSQNHNADTTDYAIYLTKRLSRNKQRHGLEDYEMEAYNKLKKGLQHKWDFVLMQAEEQVRLAKDRKKGDKIVTDSQERAYWRVYRPPTGYTNCLENAPIPDRNNMANRVKKKTIDIYKQEISLVEKQIERTRAKASVGAEVLILHSENYNDYDYFLIPTLPSNPWLTDDLTYWVLNESIVEIATEKRVRRWGISFSDLVSDPTGLNEFTSYLRKEYSHENIRFWQAVMDLRYGLASEVVGKVKRVYEEFLKPGAPCEINIDGKTMEVTQQMRKTPSRYTYDLAADHVYMLLLKKDCYPRFLRSEYYKNLQTNAVQPLLQKRRFFIFGGAGKKKASTLPNSSSLQAQTPQPLKRHGSDEQNPVPGSFSAPEPHMGISAALGVFQPKVDCDPPYSSIDRGGATGSKNEPMPEICPWEISDNVCPWDSASPPQVPCQPQQQPAVPQHAPASHQQSLQIYIPQKQQQLSKPRPDRAKSMDIHTTGPQRPQSTSFAPSLGPIKSTTPVDGSPVKNEKTKSVDVCPWEGQPTTKAITAASVASPKEPTAMSLDPNPMGHYRGTERRASEGVLRMALGVCPFEEVISASKKTSQSEVTEEENRSGAKEKTSIRIKFLSSSEQNEPESPNSLQLNKNIVPKSLKGQVPAGYLEKKVDQHRSVVTLKNTDEKKTSSHELCCTALVPYSVPQEDNEENPIDIPSGSQGPTGESPGKIPNVVAPWENSPPKNAKEDVCPWEDENGCKVDAPYVKRYTTFGYL